MRLKRFLIPALVVFAVLYVLVPTDLIKDQTPIIGRFDDLLVLVLAVTVWALNRRRRR